MIWEMNLNPEPFDLIKHGHKDVEMRLYDERRKGIKVGDEILFTNNITFEKMTVKVINLYRFKDFEELYSYFDKKRLGYKDEEFASPSDMEKYYSKDKIAQYGVLGIEIKLK